MEKELPGWSNILFMVCFHKMGSYFCTNFYLSTGQLPFAQIMAHKV